MKPTNARAVEALTGAAAGAGLGALLGRSTYRSPYEDYFPTEWVDERGEVQSRAYTPEEKKGRNKRTARLATLAAALGLAAGPATSFARRELLAMSENSQLPKVIEQYLEPLKREVERREGMYGRALPFSPGRFLGTRLTHASETLAEEEDAVRKLLRTAKQERAKRPFGGFTWGKRPGEAKTGTGQSTTTDWNEETTHRGLVHRRYDDMAKRYGYPGFNLDTKRSVLLRRLQERDLEKISALSLEAFRREATCILGG